MIGASWVPAYASLLSFQKDSNTSQLGHVIGTPLVIVQVTYGFGKPAYYMTAHQYQEFSKYAFGEWLQV